MSANIFSITNLRKWLETKDLEEGYSYADPHHCLMTQYFEDFGVEKVGAFDYGPISLRELGPWKTIAQDGEWTFGAALERAIEVEKEPAS